MQQQHNTQMFATFASKLKKREQKMKNFLRLCALCIVGLVTTVQAQERHEMDNMKVTIESDAYKKARKMEHQKSGKRSYIFGEESAYKRANGKPLSRLVSPYAEFPIKAGMVGGDYKVTIVYRITNNAASDLTPEVIIGFDEEKAQTVELKKIKNLVQKKSIDFDANLLRGKNHIVKLWLTTEGVEIDRIEVRRKLINSKKE